MVAAIVWLSLTPSPPALDFTASDKLGHLGAYGVLMFWFCMLYPSRRARVVFGAGFVAMGVGLEVIQGMSGFRSYDLADMAANGAGVVLGWLFGRALS